MKTFREERRIIGFWPAVVSYIKRRHVLQIAAYLLLAGALAFSINQERDHASQQRAALAVATRNQLLVNCERGNRLRVVLVGILEQERPQIAQAVKRGQITPEQAKGYLVRLKQNERVVGPVPCKITQRLALK